MFSLLTGKTCQLSGLSQNLRECSIAPYGEREAEGIHKPVLGIAEGLQGLCEEWPGLPCARHSRFQLDPRDALQGTAEPRRRDGGASGGGPVR